MADVKRKYNVETTLTAQKVCQLIDDGKINDLPLIVKHDAVLADTISPASRVQCNSTISTPQGSAVIDSNRVIVAYTNNSNGAYLYLVVLTITGNGISMGTPLQVNSTASASGQNTLSFVKISTDKFVMTHSINSTLSRVVSILGSTISLGGALGMNEGNSCYSTSAYIDSTHTLVTYAAWNGYMYAVVLTVSGTTLTLGVATQCGSAVHQNFCPSCAIISSTQFVITYNNYTDNNYLYAVVLTVSGTTVTFGSLNRVCSSVSAYITNCMSMGSSKFLVTFKTTATNSGDVYALLLTVSGTTITPSLLTLLCSGATWMASSIIRANKVLLNAYCAGSYAYIVTVSGSSISCGVGIIITASSYAYDMYLSQIIEDKTFVVYRDAGSSQFMFAQIINTDTVSIATPAETRNGKVIGVSLDTAGNVQLKGKCKALTGLTTGSKYYFDASGVISTTATGTFLGVALSSTELSIPDYLIS